MANSKDREFHYLEDLKCIMSIHHRPVLSVVVREF